MTPSPTPTPTSRLARFILEEYGVGEVMILVDTYGRILTEYDSDGDFRTAVVWVPGDSRIDWDSASDTELVALLNKYGYNDALTIEAGSKNVIISTNDETETLVWDNTAMDFTVDFDQWQNGTPSLFKRSVTVDGNTFDVLVNEEGKAVNVDTYGTYHYVMFTVTDDQGQQLIDSLTNSRTEEMVSQQIGYVTLPLITAGNAVNIIDNNGFYVFVNGDDMSSTPNVNTWSE